MKLLLTDIDGSLLPFGHSELSPLLIRFFQTLAEQHHNDVRATFATGKPFTRALPLAQALHITTPLICANGALIKDPVTQQTLFCRPMEEQTAQEVIHLLAHDARCQLYAEVDETLFFVYNPAIAPEAWRHMRPGWIIKPTAHDPSMDLLTSMKGVPHKIAVSTAPADREAVEKMLEAQFGDRLNIFHPKPDVIDLTPKSVDKGTALTWLTHYLNVETEDVVVVGDEMNDLPLFMTAGWRIARSHAPQEVLRLADETIDPGDEPLILAIKRALGIAYL